jgi:hypothetical protein
MIEQGNDPKTVGDLMGHANVSLTLGMYTHPNLEMKRRAVARLEETLAKYLPRRIIVGSRARRRDREISCRQPTVACKIYCAVRCCESCGHVLPACRAVVEAYGVST